MKSVFLSFFSLLFIPLLASAGTLSCTVATTCSSGVVIYRMSGTSNAHGELSAQSNYTQLVCCSGVTGLGNACSGTFATALKLSGTTNAHAEQNSQSNYAQSACIQAPSGGSVSIGYQSTNCAGFDTTLGSMSATTNAHVGDANAYTTKICGTAAGASGSLSVDIVDSGGTPVASPSISFPSKTILFNYQTSDGTFGVSAEKIRVTNTTAGAQWTLTVAAGGGATALWSAGMPKYDFNDPTANAGDGGDSDSVGGQLSFTPTSATITPQSGCATTGFSLGSSAAFSEGVTNTITLLSASASAGTNCYWDVTGIPASQSIPAEQTVGSYSLSMTLTVTAI